MIFGAILAGGTGQRMGSSIPKQFLELAGKPILIHTLERFLECEAFDALYLGVPEEWTEYAADILTRCLPEKNEAVRIVQGGEDRNETLFHVIARIEEEYGESDDHIIVTHDAVRPFVTQRMIWENIEKTKEYGTVDTVIPSVDTIVASDDGRIIADIPERKRMYRSQTPQSFRIALIKQLYGTLSDEEKSTLTDACRICVLKGQPVVMVRGEERNIKITTAEDLLIARTIAGQADTETD